METTHLNSGSAKELQPTNAVLIIDDDEGWLFIYKNMLKKAGISNPVITAHNGLEALNLLQAMAAAGQNIPELILLDIKMPVMDGFEFLEEVKKSPVIDIKNSRVYICTSSLHPKDKARASLHAVAGFITKPITPENLQHILSGGPH